MQSWLGGGLAPVIGSLGIRAVWCLMSPVPLQWLGYFLVPDVGFLATYQIKSKKMYEYICTVKKKVVLW